MTMKAIRFTAVTIILCLGMAGQGGAQKPARRVTFIPPPDMAQLQRAHAAIGDLLKTWEKCNEQFKSGNDELTWYKVYQAEVIQTPLDVFVDPKLAAKLKNKLTAEEIADLKSSVGKAITIGYYHGKEKQ